MKSILLLALSLFITGQALQAQTTYEGKLNLIKRDKSFILSSSTDSIKVSMDKKEISFDEIFDYQLVKVRNKEYNLIQNGDTISLTLDKKHVEYSNGLNFNIKKKKQHQIILTDNNDRVILDASYKLRANVARMNINISDITYETELLAFATQYLYDKSLNEVNSLPMTYFLVL